ncbi:MAG TPA: hypothetical protein VGP80_03055 [Gemmatimonadales bacterium]|nr:hypothetical protein [Gemmatimonadales bacterium]
MPVSNLASLRQFPESLRPRLFVAYAAAREALIETHQVQALKFTREFSRRLPAIDALDLYFRVVPVPMAMEDAVVSRTLVLLELGDFPPVPCEPSPFLLLRRFRLDLFLDAIRQQRQTSASTLQLARLAGARAQEAVLDTHVANAFAVASILQDVIWVDEAVGHYIHTQRLPLATAHMVYQRTRARVAERQLVSLLGASSAASPVFVERRKELRLPGQIRIAG